MKAGGEVESLFNSKAGTWNEKYRPGGPLAVRSAQFLERATALLSPNGRILDLGCGTGAIAATLAARGFQVVACDVAAQMIAAGRKNHPNSTIEWSLLPSAWDRLPFESDSFDGIVASSVFEYLIEMDRVFIECRRVLRPGGYVIATVPNPRTLIRKLERLLRPLALLLARAPVLGRVSKLVAYASYLKCSQNRMPLDGWFDLAHKTQLSPVDREKSRAGREALLFLVLRKPIAGSNPFEPPKP